MHIILVGVQEK